MKTRNVIAAAIIGVCVFATTSVFAQEKPSIQIYPSGENLKIAFGYDSKVPVFVSFHDNNGVFGTDKIDQTRFEKGFVKKYQIKRDIQNAYWVDVKNNLISARFKLEATPKGQWVSTLESVTYNNPVAMR
jgi:hypothetical protein